MLVGEWLGIALRRLGVARIYGASMPAIEGVEAVPVRDRLVARRLAEAEGRIGGVGVAGLDDQVLLASGGPAPARSITVSSPSEISAVAHALLQAAGPVPAATRVRLDLDLAAPVPADAELARNPPEREESLDGVVEAIAGASSIVVLAGPGVVRARAVDGLREFAARCSVGVLNTWGAKGVLDWRSPHHFGTVGLQRRDFELAGLADHELVVATGIDPLETREWQLAPSVEVSPDALADLAGRVPQRTRPLSVPPLFDRLRIATEAGWRSDSAPIAPTAMTRNYGEVVRVRGVVAADPGVAGFFVARTFPTARLGSALVPAAPDSDGFAVAAALVSRLRLSEPTLAIVDAPLSDACASVLEAAAELDVHLSVEVWDPGADPTDPSEHRSRCAELLEGDTTRVVTAGYEAAQLAAFEDAAGEIVAWSGREQT